MYLITTLLGSTTTNFGCSLLRGWYLPHRYVARLVHTINLESFNIRYVRQSLVYQLSQRASYPFLFGTHNRECMEKDNLPAVLWNTGSQACLNVSANQHLAHASGIPQGLEWLWDHLGS